MSGCYKSGAGCNGCGEKAATVGVCCGLDWMVHGKEYFREGRLEEGKRGGELVRELLRTLSGLFTPHRETGVVNTVFFVDDEGTAGREVLGDDFEWRKFFATYGGNEG